MTHPRPHDDDRLRRAWTAFARHDAAVSVPHRLDLRMSESVAARLPAVVPRGSRVPRLSTLAVTAATIAACLTAGVVVWRLGPAGPVTAPSPAVPDSGVAFAVGPAPHAVALTPPDAAATGRSGRRRPATTRAAAEVPSAETGPLTVADLAAAGDVLQVIRVRIDAGALEAFGVQMVGPESVGLVDVDLVVGADGWPRDVRRIRQVSDTEWPE